MPEGFSQPKRACDWSRQVGELTIQAQGLVFTIENQLETDFQSPIAHKKLQSNIRELQKLLIVIQTKNHYVSAELGNQSNGSTCENGAQIE